MAQTVFLVSLNPTFVDCYRHGGLQPGCPPAKGEQWPSGAQGHREVEDILVMGFPQGRHRLRAGLHPQTASPGKGLWRGQSSGDLHMSCLDLCRRPSGQGRWVVGSGQGLSWLWGMEN